MNDFPKHYEPAEAQRKWFPFWESHGYFNADPHSDRPSHTIVIPLPNGIVLEPIETAENYEIWIDGTRVAFLSLTEEDVRGGRTVDARTGDTENSVNATSNRDH